ncbi:MAG TPA: hypothetical protein VLF95_11655 [Vicinamibacteria bacterium]|nr:hypothetical protein [Vicinamibacteria bacterium]
MRVELLEPLRSMCVAPTAPRAFDARGDRTLLVKVPADVSHERVVAAMDVAAGATRIGLDDPAADR